MSEETKPPVPEGIQDPNDLPLARCPACKRELPGFYLRAYEVPGPSPGVSLIFQSVCCPQKDCLVALGVYFVGHTQPKIAHPAGVPWKV
jgi:hypothetical protein